MPLDTTFTAPTLSAPLPGAVAAQIGIRRLNDIDSSLDIPGYGLVTTRIMTQAANQWGPAQYFVKTSDSSWEYYRFGKDDRRGFDTFAEAKAAADAWLIRSYQTFARKA